MELTKADVANFFLVNSKKIIFWSLAGMFILFAAMGGVFWQYSQPVAVVNGKKITRAEYNRASEIETKTAQYMSDNTLTSDKIKNDLIEKEIVRTAANENKITVSEDEVTLKLEDIAKTDYEGDIDRLFEAYNASYGYTEQELRDQTGYAILKEKVKQNVLNKKSGKYIYARFNTGNGVEEATGLTDPIAMDAWAKSEIDKYYAMLESGKTFNKVAALVNFNREYTAPVLAISEFEDVNQDSTAMFPEEQIKAIMSTEQGKYSKPVKMTTFYAIYYVDNGGTGKYNDWDEFVSDYKNKYVAVNAFIVKEKVAKAATKEYGKVANLIDETFGTHFVLACGCYGAVTSGNITDAATGSAIPSATVEGTTNGGSTCGGLTYWIKSTNSSGYYTAGDSGWEDPGCALNCAMSGWTMTVTKSGYTTKSKSLSLTNNGGTTNSLSLSPILTTYYYCNSSSCSSGSYASLAACTSAKGKTCYSSLSSCNSVCSTTTTSTTKAGTTTTKATTTTTKSTTTTTKSSGNAYYCLNSKTSSCDYDTWSISECQSSTYQKCYSSNGTCATACVMPTCSLVGPSTITVPAGTYVYPKITSTNTNTWTDVDGDFYSSRMAIKDVATGSTQYADEESWSGITSQLAAGTWGYRANKDTTLTWIPVNGQNWATGTSCVVNVKIGAATTTTTTAPPAVKPTCSTRVSPVTVTVGDKATLHIDSAGVSMGAGNVSVIAGYAKGQEDSGNPIDIGQHGDTIVNNLANGTFVTAGVINQNMVYKYYPNSSTFVGPNNEGMYGGWGDPCYVSVNAVPATTTTTTTIPNTCPIINLLNPADDATTTSVSPVAFSAKVRDAENNAVTMTIRYQLNGAGAWTTACTHSYAAGTTSADQTLTCPGINLLAGKYYWTAQADDGNAACSLDYPALRRLTVTGPSYTCTASPSTGTAPLTAKVTLTPSAVTDYIMDHVNNPGTILPSKGSPFFYSYKTKGTYEIWFKNPTSGNFETCKTVTVKGTDNGEGGEVTP